MDRLEGALEDCVARLASGEATLDECLARYPEDAGELRRLLAAVNRLEQGRNIRLSAASKARGRARLAAHMRARPRGRSATRTALTPPVAVRIAFGIAAAALMFLTTGAALAQAALPGEALYGWKIASERVWRAVQTDPLATDLTLAGRRARELALVAGDPRAETIARVGYQQALADLARYRDPDSQAIIQAALADQQERLRQAGLSVPELDSLVTVTSTVEPSLDLTATLAGVIVTTPTPRASSTPTRTATAAVLPTLPLPTASPPLPVATVSTPTVVLPAHTATLPLPTSIVAPPTTTLPPAPTLLPAPSLPPPDATLPPVPTLPLP